MDPMHPLPAPNPGAGAQLIAATLAHLAAHLGSTCPRAARRARCLLARIAADTANDVRLRQQADELRDVLEDDGRERTAAGARR